jgi:branched-chain amino acid aminotransferase
MDLAAELGLPLEVRKVTAQELLEADEAFYTSSAGGIMPLHSVDGVVLGQRNATGPGPVAAKLHDLYWEKRWAGWHGRPVDYAALG